MKYNLQNVSERERERETHTILHTSIKCTKYQNHILHRNFSTCFNFCFVAIIHAHTKSTDCAAIQCDCTMHILQVHTSITHFQYIKVLNERIPSLDFFSFFICCFGILGCIAPIICAPLCTYERFDTTPSHSSVHAPFCADRRCAYNIVRPFNRMCRMCDRRAIIKQ